MISSAFKGAYVSSVQAEHKVSNQIQAGIRDAASIATIAALGFTGALSDEAILKGVSRMGASRLGGIGGTAVMAALGEKKETAVAKADNSQALLSKEEVTSQLGDNPINRAAVKKLNTVYDTLVSAKEQGIIKNNKIQSDIGDINVNSPLGTKIIEQLGKED